MVQSCLRDPRLEASSRRTTDGAAVPGEIMQPSPGSSGNVFCLGRLIPSQTRPI